MSVEIATAMVGAAVLSVLLFFGDRPGSFVKKHTDGVGLSPVSRNRTGVVARRKVRV